MVLPLVPILLAGKVAAVSLATFAGHRAMKGLQRPEHYKDASPDFASVVRGVPAWKGEGVVYGPTGSVISTEEAEVQVSWTRPDGGHLGVRLQGEKWVRGMSSLSFTLDGAAGTVDGDDGRTGFVLSGNSCSFARDTARSDVMGGIRLHSDEWIFALSSGNLLYQGVYSRLGVPLASATFFLTPLRSE